MRRLAAAGFKRDFARLAVFPEWWDASCEADAQLLTEVELRIARFLGAPLALVRDPRAPLVVPTYEGAQLRRVKDINRDRLGPAIHAALNISAAVVRNTTLPDLQLPPTDALAWRTSISRPNATLRLDDVLSDLWRRGIPVVHVDSLPAPAFQGLACIVEKRPVILICHNLDEPARLAFVIAHEVAHIVNGDCSDGHPVVDGEEEIPDDADLEKLADAYAASLLTGGEQIPDVRASGFKDLAQKAATIEKEHGVDASAVIWTWARRTGDYAKATMAAQALYRTRGGKRAIRMHLDTHLELDDASDSDRALLRCLCGDPERHAAAAG
jgi:Zn-dependent peptidase ImmA (M78 family)